MLQVGYYQEFLHLLFPEVPFCVLVLCGVENYLRRFGETYTLLSSETSENFSLLYGVTRKGKQENWLLVGAEYDSLNMTFISTFLL
jgi:hypothetical protein